MAMEQPFRIWIASLAALFALYPLSGLAVQAIGSPQVFLDRFSDPLRQNNIFVPSGIATDRDGNVFVYDSTSAGTDVIRKYDPQRRFLGSVQVHGMFSVATPGGYLARDPATDALFVLISDGEMRRLDPVSGLMTVLFDLRRLPIDVQAPYDILTSRSVGFSAGLLVPPFQWGDFAVLSRGERTDFFISGKAGGGAIPFILRVRVENGRPVSARVPVFSRGTTAGNVNLTRGVAVSPGGVVLTTLPILTEIGAGNIGIAPLSQPLPPSDIVFRPAPSPFATCRTPDGSACSVFQDSAVAFSADFDPTPFTDPQAALNALNACRALPCPVPVVLLDRPQNNTFDPVNVPSLGMTADAAGNFYIATGPVGSAHCGFFASGAMVVIPSTLNFLICAQAATSPINTSVDVALSSDARSAYMSLANLGIVASFDVTPSPLPAVLNASVLPTSRSVQVGIPATAFATILNSGLNPAVDCGIALASPFTGSFNFRTTDPNTNRPVGAINVPATIPPGGFQTYVLVVNPASPTDTRELQLVFQCANTADAAAIPGVNTLTFSASATPVPDVVALAATLSNDGIVTVSGVGGTGVFAVATVNVGATGSLTVSADTGGAMLPVSLSLCETVPATGACKAPPAPAVTTVIAANATPTFGVFVNGKGAVPFDPAGHRVFVRFRETGGAVRGATSVAVRTP